MNKGSTKLKALNNAAPWALLFSISLVVLFQLGLFTSPTQVVTATGFSRVNPDTVMCKYTAMEFYCVFENNVGVPIVVKKVTLTDPELNKSVQIKLSPILEAGALVKIEQTFNIRTTEFDLKESGEEFSFKIEIVYNTGIQEVTETGLIRGLVD